MPKRLLLLAALFAVVLPAFAQSTDEALKPIRIDKNHSTLGFEVPIAGHLSKVTGKFTEFDLELFWNPDDLAASSVRTTIQVASIDTGIDDRDADLRSENFFDAETFPTITFESDHFEPAGDGFLAHGTLTMHGVSKEIALPFQVVSRPDPDDPNTLWYAFAIQDFVLDRTDYGIDWEHGLLPFFVGDKVTLALFVMTR